ncbi:MAG: hypothetical protein HKN12_03230 [Gemmatimonadetes bacterium]|nr:hypothetical protein [Gemmatimonadota bacterium]
MRKSLVFAIVAILACSSMVFAGVPDPARSGCGTNAASSACHYRIIADGSQDIISCSVTLRDAFDTPVASCSTSASLVFTGGGTGGQCACGGITTFTGTTDAGGVVTFATAALGGSGGLDINITAHCVGNIAICTKSVLYTTPDLTASCESGTPSTTVADLGAWASGLTAYNVWSDYTCDAAVGVADLGFWAGGLTVGCP